MLSQEAISKLLRSRMRSRLGRVGTGLRDSTSTPSLQMEIGQVVVERQAECSGRWLCSARACDQNGQGLRRNLKLQDPIGNTRARWWRGLKADDRADQKMAGAVSQGAGAGTGAVNQSMMEGGMGWGPQVNQSSQTVSAGRARALLDLSMSVSGTCEEPGAFGGGERAVERGNGNGQAGVGGGTCQSFVQATEDHGSGIQMGWRVGRRRTDCRREARVVVQQADRRTDGQTGRPGR